MAARFDNIDHDSICKFRRENKELLSSTFHQVLELAAAERFILSLLLMMIAFFSRILLQMLDRRKIYTGIYGTSSPR